MYINFVEAFNEGRAQLSHMQSISGGEAITNSYVTIHPMVDAIPVLEIQVPCVGDSIFSCICLNRNPKSLPVRYSISIFNIHEDILGSFSAIVADGSSFQVEIPFNVPEELVLIRLSTSMARYEDSTSRAWATFKDVFVGSLFDFYAAKHGLSRLMRPAKNFAVAAGEWKSIVSETGHCNLYDKRSYCMASYQSGNQQLFEAVPNEWVNIYKDLPRQTADAVELFAIEDLVHVYHGICVAERFIVYDTFKYCPDHSALEFYKSYENISGTLETLSLEHPLLIASHYGKSNYGHWLIEMLPRVICASKILGSNQFFVGLSAEQASVSTIIESILEAGITKEQLVILPNKPIIIKRALITSPASRHMHVGWMSPMIHQELNGLSRIPPVTDQKRIFVSRKDAKSRQLLNEDEIFEFLQDFGFERVCFGSLSFKEQISIFSAASHVVGVFGAALSNAVFMPAFSTLTVLSPSHFVDHFYWNICSICSIRYQEVVGTAVKNINVSPAKQDFTVSLQDFKSFYCKES